jgi:hypothetical protein
VSVQAKPRRSKDSKEIKQRAVSKAVLEIVEMQGLSGITHSKVSRRSKVSRAWIYEYIGKEKVDLAKFAAQIFGEQFARVGGDLPKNASEIRRQLDEGIHFLFDCAVEDPVIIRLYFRFRGASNALGEIIERYERIWLESAVKKLEDFAKLPREQCLRLADLMLALRLGSCHRIITSENPEVARRAVEKTFGEFHALVEVGAASQFFD